MEANPKDPKKDAMARYAKTPKGRQARGKAIENYRQTEGGKAAEKKYRQSPKGKAAIAEAGRRYREKKKREKLEGGQT